MSFQLKIYDNSHYMDESAAYPGQIYQNYVEALLEARKIVRESLLDLYQPGMPPGELLSMYKMFGEDPVIIGIADIWQGELFQAWAYAEEIIDEIGRVG